MDNFDAIFSLPEGKEVLNTHGVGKYSFSKKGENAYTLDIGDGYRQINMKFAIEMAEGVLYWNYGAATAREMYENEEMRRTPAKHLFIYLDNNKVDLLVDEFPMEIRISNSHVTYDPTDLGDLEFDLEISYEHLDPMWYTKMSFTVMHSENKYQFGHLGNTYDSEEGKLEKIIL